MEKEFLHELYAKYHDVVTFATVYITEAHASDQWPLGNSVSIPQHKTIADRQAAALKMVNEWNWKIPLYLDTMNNTLHRVFGAWPERFVIAGADKQVLWIGEADSEGSTDGWDAQMKTVLQQLFPNH